MDKALQEDTALVDDVADGLDEVVLLFSPLITDNRPFLLKPMVEEEKPWGRDSSRKRVRPEKLPERASQEQDGA